MAEFTPTHRLRKQGTDEWTEVRADGVEPQTYYDRKGKTIFAGIWFQDMEVQSIETLATRRDRVREHFHIGMAQIGHTPARVNFPEFDSWLEAERSDAVRNAFELQAAQSQGSGSVVE